MVWIARVLGLAAFCVIAAGSPYETKNQTSVSTGTYTSSSLDPTQTDKANSLEKGQKDYDGENKKEGGVKKEQKDYDGGNNKKGNVEKGKDYRGGNKDGKKESDKPNRYGSGYSNWGQEYNDCVQQCKSNYGKPPSATANPKPAKTHIVKVAPAQGILRYAPFSVQACVGDTVRFEWGANNHTVTKASAILRCNKTLDKPFTSGTQNKEFVFELPINDTEPIYFYCGTPNHCNLGMFAVINPPMANNPMANNSTSVGKMLPLIAANNSKIAAYSQYASSQTTGNMLAANWGSEMDLAAFPSWAQPFAAENVLYTRSLLGINPGILKDDGYIDMSGTNSTSFNLPKDVKEIVAPPAASGNPSSGVYPTAIGTPSPGISNTASPSSDTALPSSDTPLPSDPNRSSSLSTSGGYVASAAKALILGPVSFIVFFIVL